MVSVANVRLTLAKCRLSWCTSLLIDVPDQQAAFLLNSGASASLVAGCDEIFRDWVPSDAVALALLSSVKEALLDSVGHVGSPKLLGPIALKICSHSSITACTMAFFRCVDQQDLAGRSSRHNASELFVPGILEL